MTRLESRFSQNDSNRLELQSVTRMFVQDYKEIELQGDLFKVNNKNRSSSLPTLVGGANGGSEIVKMWKDYFKGILNSENSANGSAESV